MQVGEFLLEYIPSSYLCIAMSFTGTGEDVNGGVNPQLVGCKALAILLIVQGLDTALGGE